MTEHPPALPTDGDVALGFVRDLQRDGRLLLRHIARRTDRSVAAPAGAPKPGAPVRTLRVPSLSGHGRRGRLPRCSRCPPTSCSAS